MGVLVQRRQGWLHALLPMRVVFRNEICHLEVRVGISHVYRTPFRGATQLLQAYRAVTCEEPGIQGLSLSRRILASNDLRPYAERVSRYLRMSLR